MHFWPAIILSITLIACATNPSSDRVPPGSAPTEKPNDSDKDAISSSEQLVKSPQGYVINGPKARFGGFIGDCASDENFPYFWDCQRENAGDDFN